MEISGISKIFCGITILREVFLSDASGNKLMEFDIRETFTPAVYEFIETLDGSFISFHIGNQVTHWDKDGKLLKIFACDNIIDLEEFIVWLPYQQLNENIKVKKLLHLLIPSQPFAYIPTTTEEIVMWHGDSDCHSWYFEEDGTYIISQSNGQINFLRTYHGTQMV